MIKKLLALLLIGFLISDQLIAFGSLGHRIVGEVASHYLNENAKQAIAEIMGTGSFQTHGLAHIANWADEIRSDIEWKSGKKNPDQWNDKANNTLWHYATINSPEDLAHLNQVPKSIYDGMIVLKLQESEDILRGKIAGDKEQALKWLVHLMGDLHQPLHVGSGNDYGGNKKAVKWFDEPTNLHDVWDKKLLAQDGRSYTEFAQYLIDSTTEDQAKAWASGNYISWATESDAMRKEIYASGDPNWENQPNFEYQYLFDNRPRMEQRLKQAGIRLANLLNDIFAKR